MGGNPPPLGSALPPIAASGRFAFFASSSCALSARLPRPPAHGACLEGLTAASLTPALLFPWAWPAAERRAWTPILAASARVRERAPAPRSRLSSLLPLPPPSTPPRTMGPTPPSPPVHALPVGDFTAAPLVPLLLRAALGRVGLAYTGVGRRRPAAKGAPRRQLPAGMRGESPLLEPLATPMGVEATRCCFRLACGTVATPIVTNEEDQGAAWTSPSSSGAQVTLEVPASRRSGGARPAGPASGTPTAEPPRAGTDVRSWHTAACAVVVPAATGPPPNPPLSISE